MVSFKVLGLGLSLLAIQTGGVRAQTASCGSKWGWVRVNVFLSTKRLTWATSNLDEQYRWRRSLSNRRKS
jgi:hypothetical protein